MLDVAITGTIGDLALDVVFDAPDGVTALFGPSGAGKTTVVNAIAGLWTPQEGRIAVGDQVWWDSTTGVYVPAPKRRIGYVFQDGRLFPHMSVAQNLAYGGVHDRDRLIDVLALASLLDRRPAGLSGGEKQRVALGRALMSDPQLILMDEPLAALDAPRKAEILPYLARIRDTADVPIVYVSHAMGEVVQLATTLVLIADGKVQQAGPLADVLNNPQSAAVLGPRGAGAVLTCRVQAHAAHGTVVAYSGGTIALQGQHGAAGETLRLRLPARDIILSREAPTGISAMNVMPAKITALDAVARGGIAVGLMTGQDRFWAEITAQSAQRMGLEVGQDIHAIIKATAITL